jgi:hypothetical protein
LPDFCVATLKGLTTYGLKGTFMVKYWRSKAVNIVLYLDDGLGMSLDYDSCFKDSFFIRKSLTEAV